MTTLPLSEVKARLSKVEARKTKPTPVTKKKAARHVKKPRKGRA